MLSLGPPMHSDPHAIEADGSIGKSFRQPGARNNTQPEHVRLISNNLKAAFPVQDDGSFASLLRRLDRI
jgi:hypothetical protein